MMFESIKRQLNEIGCTMYELTEVSRTAWEFYFIRHRLDQNRVVTTRTLLRGRKDPRLRIREHSSDGL